MPKPSQKAQLQELLLYFGYDLDSNSSINILEDEDILLLLSMIQTSRYLGERSMKATASDNVWWQAAINDPTYNEESFKVNFRMTRPIFLEVLKLISGHTAYNGAKAPISLQLAVTLYRFGTYGNASSLDLIAEKFGIGKGSVLAFTERTISAIISLSKLFIYWPDSNERKSIGADMAKKGLPKCVGYVDGTDVGFSSAPVDNKEVYWSRKKKYCMQVQIICDPDKVIRDLFTGYPGSVHDAKIFSLSSPGSNPKHFFTNGEFVIGDSACALTDTVVVPFRRTMVGLSTQKKKFNQHLSSHRVAVEHTIGMLKSRFQSLHELRILITKEGHCKAVHWIHACAILHNILVKKEPWNQEEVPCEEENDFAATETEEMSRSGVNKRQALLEIFTALN